MRRREPARPLLSGDAPPRELLRFRPSEVSPTTADGRPMPCAVKWRAEEFEAFLRDRQEWRRTHAEPLPRLFGSDRLALRNLAERGELNPAVVAAERAAPTAVPEWVERTRPAHRAKITSRTPIASGPSRLG